MLTFSDAEDTINDSEIPDYKEDGIEAEMQMADRFVYNYNGFCMSVRMYYHLPNLLKNGKYA